MRIQEFIHRHPNDWRQILKEKPYSIKITEDQYHIILKYNQIESDFNDPLVRECRGLILYKDNYDVACRPFEKFGNYGEGYVPVLDWTSAKVQEKLDGSLIKVWFSWSWNLWMVSTNGTIEADNADLSGYHPTIKTFADLFWYTLEDEMGIDGNELFQSLNRTKTYLFEICTPLNRVVVPHKDYKLYYLATKDNATGEETIDDLPFPRPREYPLNSLEECVEAAKQLPFNDEGYVVVDQYLNRLKIKGDEYITVHHLRGEGILSEKRVLRLIRTNEHQEYLNYYPEDKAIFDEIEEHYQVYIEYIYGDLEILEKFQFDTRKEAAEYINKNCTNPAICFNFLDGKLKNMSVEEWLERVPDDTLIKRIRQ